MSVDYCIIFNCTNPADPVPVGWFELDRKSGNGRFGYGLRYLARADAVELDPIHLPLKTDEIEVKRRGDDTFGVFSDAGSNAWGAALTLKLLREDEKPRPETVVDRWLNSSHCGSGCIGFSPDPQTPPNLSIPVGKSRDLSARLLGAVEKYLSDPTTKLDAETANLLFPGSGLGGLRPKTVVMHEGIEHIAKFSRPDDLFDVPAVEFATLRLAMKAGVNVPDFEHLNVAGRSVLLVERFDRTAGGGRVHYASAFSFLNPGPLSADQREYKTSFSYAGIAEILRPYGENAQGDSHELYRRMIVNLMVGNVDDHLRNHAFLMTGPGRYRLSPAFDIVPHMLSAERPQSIGVGAFGTASTIENALSHCGRFLLEPGEARTVIAEVKEAVSTWRAEFAVAGVTRQDEYTLAPCFALADKADRVQVALGDVAASREGFRANDVTTAHPTLK